ncbi:MAG TPA: 5-dehydro-2-deoxygluconokinase [Burkholderiaceae bacterium]|nr:5-dehydro-2-deoxygluconokinase [Burkholderiaceae bacterium]
MRNRTQFADGRPLEVICLGRLAVDLYAHQVGSPLEDVASFARYLGGSAGNTAFGAARLGLKSSMLTRVGDEQNGRFLVRELAREGCDVSHVRADPQRLTALAFLGLKDRDTFPLLFYRENCADMAIDESDVDPTHIGQSRALLISGTHLSAPTPLRASLRALELARAANVRTILDIDYRPVLWGLTGRGDGATRFVASEGVTAHLQRVLPLFDLLVGTEEEFLIAGGSTDLTAALRAVRRVTAATFVVKRGPLGCAVIDGDVPGHIDDAFNRRGIQVEVLNVLGAGDAFMAGFLRGWLRGEDYETCCDYANACGALVVSRHSCAPAMPTWTELQYFLAKAPRRPDRDQALSRLHRVTVPRQQWPEVFVFAFDHRAQFFEAALEAGADEARVPTLKKLLVKAVELTEADLGLQGRIGLLADDRYGQDALADATGRGWWIGRPVEVPGSNPLEFDQGLSIGSHLIAWPREHIVKCLVQFHPDDAVGNRLQQETQLHMLNEAVQASGHELLLEIIPPRNLPQEPDTVLRAMKRLYNIGIAPEWWKLEAMTESQWSAIDALIAARDPHCRGVVLLGLDASIETLRAGFAQARASRTCRGFAVGRTIFREPSRLWLRNEIGDAELITRVRDNFETLIRCWRDQRASAPAQAGHAERQAA